MRNITKLYVPLFYTVIYTLSVPFYIFLSIDLFLSGNIEKKNQQNLLIKSETEIRQYF